MDWKLQLFKLNYDTAEKDAVLSVLDSGWLTMGTKTIEFEDNFKSLLNNGGTQCIAVSSCTAALHMSLLALGIGSGDEVIIPGLTFIADANSVMMTGAKPVLADSHSFDDWNLSKESIENVITEKTKAVIVVHFAGFPCNMDEILNFCKEKNIYIIEDVAHAPGATFNGRFCGTFGDIGCFSFFSNKNLSIGEGGMVVSSNPELLKTLKHLRSHGMTTLTLDRHKGRSSSYDVVEPGLNYRIDEIRASLGLVQIQKLLKGNSDRKKLFNRYRSNLSKSGFLIPFKSLNYSYQSAYHILPVLLPLNYDRKDVIKHLKNCGIQSSIHYPSITDFSGYRDIFTSDSIPIAYQISMREITLPLYPTMSESDVDFVTKSLLNIK